MNTLEVRGVSLSFGGLKAVSELSLTLPEGTLFGLIGPNGAGKTTVFNLVTNILAKDAGQVRFLGRDLAGMSAVKIASLGLIRTFQAARVFPGMTELLRAAPDIPLGPVTVDSGSLRLISYALLLILVMILRPKGLFGTGELWHFARRRRAA